WGHRGGAPPGRRGHPRSGPGGRRGSGKTTRGENGHASIPLGPLLSTRRHHIIKLRAHRNPWAFGDRRAAAAEAPARDNATSAFLFPQSQDARPEWAAHEASAIFPSEATFSMGETGSAGMTPRPRPAPERSRPCLRNPRTAVFSSLS